MSRRTSFRLGRFLGRALVLALASTTAVVADPLTIEEGVVVKFGPDGQLVVRDGLTVGDGALFSSESDDTALGPVGAFAATPAPGDWIGICIEPSAVGPALQLSGLRIRYAGRDGTGALRLRGTGGSLSGFTIEDTSGAGLFATTGATSAISQIAVRRSDVGVFVAAGASISFTGSLVEQNGTGAVAETPTGQVVATTNWWGHPTGPLDASDDTAAGGLFNPTGLGNPVSDGIDWFPVSNVIPLFGLGFSLPEGAIAADPIVPVELRAPTASSFRLSEDPSFTGIAFQPMTDTTEFELSAGEGLKTIHAQFQAATGNSASLSRQVRFDTAGPTLALLQPGAGTLLQRPLTVVADAIDPAGVERVEFLVDGVLVATDFTNTFSFDWDVRGLSGTHQLGIRGRDTIGRETVIIQEFSISPRPPVAPVITTPATGTETSAASLVFSGSAEAFTTVTLRRGAGQVVGQVSIGSSGAFATDVPLVEGLNVITAVASDVTGVSPSSSAVNVLRDSGPPGAPSLALIPGAGGLVRLQWIAPTDETPAFYRVYRANTSFATPAGATLIQDNVLSTSLVDHPTGDGTRFYAVAAVDNAGNQGPLSNVVQASVDALAPTASVVAAPTSPVGPGTVTFTLTASEPLATTPSLTIVPAGGTTMSIELSASGLQQWTSTLAVSAGTPSGVATLGFSGQDAAGNLGTTITSGGTLTIDTRGPAGTIATQPAGTVGSGPVALTLTLDEPAVGTPVLRFLPPAGGPVAIVLTGGPTQWTGTLIVTGTMGDGAGSFELEATDALGNTRTGVLPGATLSITTTPPGAPIGLAATTRPAGAIRLTWSAVAGASSYSLYRLPAALAFPDPSQVRSATAITTTEFSDTPPTDGTWRFAVAALDGRGNESALSTDAVAVSDRVAPSTPTGVGLVIEGTGVRVTFTAPGADPTDRYGVFRATAPIVSVVGLVPIASDLAVTTLLDTPPADGAYHYAVVALDVAGNPSAPGGAGPITFDQGAPEITITGVTDGQVAPSDVTPVLSATDFSLETLTATLDAAPFASGTVVTAEGAHVLLVTATDSTGRTAERTVAFSIDRTAPAIGITGVADGASLENAVTPVVVVTDAHLGPVTITLNGQPFVSGTMLATDGSYVLRVAAEDAAGNDAETNVAFTLDAAPSAPVYLDITLAADGFPLLGWPAVAEPDVVGYRVRRNGSLAAPAPIPGTSFVDAGFAPGAVNAYAVSAVDAGGHEGAAVQSTLRAVTLAVSSYGLLFDTTGAPVFDPSGGTTTASSAGVDPNALTRRYLDQVKLEIRNLGAEPVTPGALRLTLRSGSSVIAERTLAAPGAVASGGSRQVTEVLPTGATAGTPRTLEAELVLQGGPGRVLVRTERALQMRETPLPVEIFSDPLVRGATTRVRVKVFNHGSTPIQLLTATPDGPSPEVEVRLLGSGGSVLASSRLEHRGAGTTVTAGGTYVTIPVGGSFLSPTIPLQVPSTAPDQVRVEGIVSATHLALFTPGDLAGAELRGGADVSIGNPPYLAEAAVEQGVYDQGQAVGITGRAFSTQGVTTAAAAVADKVVKIGVSTRGFVRYLTAVTDENGDFTATFAPFASEAGAYTVWATHPTVTEQGAQDEFQILGLELRPSRMNARFSRNGSLAFPIRLKNIGEVPLDGLAASITAGPGISGSIDLSQVPAPFPPGASADMRVTLNATVDADFANFADVVLTAASGAVRALPIQIELLDALPTIVTAPSFVEVGVTQGNLVARNIEVRNAGFAPLTGIHIDAPRLPWVRLASVSDLPPIPPGGFENVTVLFNPDETINQGVFGDSIVIRSGNHVPYTVNLVATVTSAARGGVEFEVRNILNQLVPGASVSIRSTVVPDLVLTSTTDAEGLVSFLDLPAGPFQYKVQATGHEVSISSFTVDPDTIKPLTVFLNVAFVTIDWSVTPVVIQDRYDVTLTTTFETQVPAPVLTADPGFLRLELAPGSTYVGTMRITNHGLIAADDVRVTTTADPHLALETLVASIDRIPANATAEVPFRLHRLPEAAPGVALPGTGRPAGEEAAAGPPAAPRSFSDCLPPLPAGVVGTGSWLCPAGFSASSSAGTSMSVDEPPGACDEPDCESCMPCSCLGLIPVVGEAASGICECIAELSNGACLGEDPTGAICACIGSFVDSVGTACDCLLPAIEGDSSAILACLGEVATGALADVLGAIDNITDAFECGFELGLCLLQLDIEIDGSPGTASCSSCGGGGGGGGWGGPGGGISGGWTCD